MPAFSFLLYKDILHEIFFKIFKQKKLMSASFFTQCSSRNEHFSFAKKLSKSSLFVPKSMEKIKFNNKIFPLVSPHFWHNMGFFGLGSMLVLGRNQRLDRFRPGQIWMAVMAAFFPRWYRELSTERGRVCTEWQENVSKKTLGYYQGGPNTECSYCRGLLLPWPFLVWHLCPW